MEGIVRQDGRAHIGVAEAVNVRSGDVSEDAVHGWGQHLWEVQLGAQVLVVVIDCAKRHVAARPWHDETVGFHVGMQDMTVAEGTGGMARR